MKRQRAVNVEMKTKTKTNNNKKNPLTFEEYVLPSPLYESRSFHCLYLYFHLYGSAPSLDCPVVDVSKRKKTESEISLCGIVCIGKSLAHF